MENLHYTVMKEELVEGVLNDTSGTYVDGTFGRGGHTELLLQNLTSAGRVFAFDQDIEAISHGKKKSDPRVELIHANFASLKEELTKRGIDQVSGVMLDLGFSSPQIDDASRGFSYMQEGPLDMRMNQEQALDARQIVNGYDRRELIDIFQKYGEEKYAGFIADGIIKSREKGEIETTTQLVAVIEESIPQKFLKKIKGHSAKKVFQALRIEVNQELQVLNTALVDSIDLLASGGRIGVITFHSLEDKMVKDMFRKYSSVNEELAGLPVIPDEYLPEYKLVTSKPLVPSDEELAENSRSKSAKLRILERI